MTNRYDPNAKPEPCNHMLIYNQLQKKYTCAYCGLSEEAIEHED